jgi:hypothetical protein
LLTVVFTSDAVSSMSWNLPIIAFCTVLGRPRRSSIRRRAAFSSSSSSHGAIWRSTEQPKNSASVMP